MKVVIATRNPGKVQEIRSILAGSPYELVGTEDFPGWMPPPEDADDYLANALAKARSLAAFAGMPAVADDSGIEADALDGAPGVRSARFAGEGASDAQNLDALLVAMRDVQDEARRGRFRCVAVCATPGGDDVWAEATLEGRIIREPYGTGGFGYDPVFLPDGYGRTTAELDADEKDRISHRGKAFRALEEKMTRFLA